MWKPGAPPLPTHPSPAILSAALSGSPVSFAALRLSQRSDALRSQLHLLSTRSTFSEPCFRRLLLQSRSGRFLSGVEKHSLTYCVFLSSTSYTHARTLSLSVSNLGSRFSYLLLLLHRVRRANTPASNTPFKISTKTKDKTRVLDLGVAHALATFVSKTKDC